MSERYNAKKLKREAAERWQRGEHAYAHLPIVAGNQRASTGASSSESTSHRVGMLCRMHGNPWRTCSLCGPVLTK